MRISDWSSDVCSSDLENPHSWRSSWLLGWLLPLCLIALSLTIPSMRDVAAVWFSAWALLLILVDSEINNNTPPLRRPLRLPGEPGWALLPPAAPFPTSAEHPSALPPLMRTPPPLLLLSQTPHP